MTTSWPILLAFGFVLCLVQFLAALPWLLAWRAVAPLVQSWKVTWAERSRGGQIVLMRAFLGLALAGAAFAGVLFHQRGADYLNTLGRFYGGILTFQLLLDVVVLVFAVLLQVWPRGAAVARAAFFEGIRQPMFALLIVLALVAMVLMPFIPYFTFGEDIKMVKELGYDTIMLFPGLFAVLAASMSISEEIEGRTAITLMSKPVSRRQFLLGKFVGILMAAVLMTGLLSLMFFLVVWLKPIYDREDLPAAPEWVNQVSQFWPTLGEAPAQFVKGMLWWFADAVTASPGLVLGFCQVMVLLAIAAALATRLPMVVNLVVCLFIFFMGHLTHVLAQVSQGRYRLVQFMAQLFDTLLPGLDFFNIGPALTRDTYPPAGAFSLYIGTVTLYACLYTAIALLFGLILFEDRDLA